MELSDFVNNDIKLTVIDKEEENNECYFEIVVNRNFVNTIFLSFLLMKNSLSKEIYLTPREEEVLTRIANGKDNLTIAKEMNLSRHTIKIHIRKVK